MYANLPIWEPYLQPGSHNFTNGASFASAGAAVLVETNPSTLNIRIQLSYLKEVVNLLKEELGDTEAKNIQRMQSNCQVSEEIYEMGGRKFAFQNVGPFGCQPELKQQYNLSGKACVEELQTIASLHNNALSNVTRELESQLSGFNYMNFDFFNALNDMTSHPEKYCFKVSDIACSGTGSHRGSGCGRVPAYELCSVPNEYVFFDGGHPTE
ncbi:hypothetical protein Ddye_014387 [Dipteronia dyeriana]|uniref:Uncharacterized protein n=1 Tax=Dipteronia dyeriana TaxID=168575 RepID=A0AAD9X8A3_9ROSI|nr:hypothetical protein Ddye_014387 [Dipteronia dyeriana]